MRNIPRSCIALAVIGLTTVLACGETTPTEPDPVATSITATAGDAQTATTSTTLPTALTVTILDDNGAAFSGATVAWSVVSGGGALSTSESTTGADGTASTMWTLGQTAGVQTARATSGSLAIDFTATAEAGPFMPTADVMISGEMDVTSFTIPAGVTVTAEEDVVINATETFVVDGSLVADCMAVEVNSAGELSVTGTMQNVCDTTLVESGPDLILNSTGAISFENATIESMGAITISNVTSAPLASGPGVARNHRGLDCIYEGFAVNVLFRARHGDDGVEGGPGSAGRDVTFACAGDAVFIGGRVILGTGGSGGVGASTTSAPARGGKGGRGADLIINSDESIRFGVAGSDDAFVVVLGQGGPGGPAIATGESPVAVGGDAGRAGLAFVSAAGDIVIEEPNAFSLRPGLLEEGRGGSAAANGDDGADATSSTVAQPGASADATAGVGSRLGLEEGTTNLIGDLFAATNVVNPEHIELDIGDELVGWGGEATAVAGSGGNGVLENPHGADAGMTTARGGDGGDISLFDNRGAGEYVGTAGNGGSVILGPNQGRTEGGTGFDGCSEGGGNLPGGNGGDGGDVTAGAGLGGLVGGTRSGFPGTVTIRNTANGGLGGPGEGWGAGGEAGSEILVVGAQTVTNSYLPGLDGNDCPGAQPPFVSFEAIAAEAMIRAFHTSLVLFAVAKESGALASTADGVLVADLLTAASTTMYGVAGLGDAVSQFLVFGLTGIYANTAALPSEVPPGVSGLEGGPTRAPADITLERASLSVAGVSDNDGNTTDGVPFGNDPSADGAVFAQNGDNNVLIVVKDGSGMPIVDPATANVFKPGGTSIFGDDRVVSAFAGANGFTESDPMLVVTEAPDGTGKLWRVDLVGGAAVPTEETDVFVWAGPRRVRCLMPQGVCAVSSFGAGFSLGGTTLFTWDGGANVEQVPGFSARAGAYLGIDLVPSGSNVAMVLPGFNGNDYSVDLLDGSTGEIIETNTYDAPAGCMPGHAIFRPRTDGGAPTEVLLSCNGSGEVVSVPVAGGG